MTKYEKILALYKDLKKDETIMFKFDEYLHRDEDCDCFDNRYGCENGCGEYIVRSYSLTGIDEKEKQISMFNPTEGDLEMNSDGGHVYANLSSFKVIKKKLKFKLDKVWESKRPKTKQNHIGIEIEFISKLTDTELSTLIAENDLEENIELKGDGSLNSEGEYRFTHEICVLAGEKAIFGIVTKLCNLLKDSSKVNRSCGLHVHLDMRNRNPNKAYANLFSMQKLLYSMCPKSRHTGSYSRPETEYFEVDFEDEWTLEDEDRYRGINYAAFARHKTIEVRIHSGSLNPKKINNWVKILLRIVNIKSSAKEGTLIDNYVDVKSTLKLKGRLEAYVLERIEAFKERNEKSKMKIAL